MRFLLMSLAALLVAGTSGFYLLQGLAPAAQPAAAVQVEVAPPVEVYVPAAALAAGTILLPEHLGRMPIEKDAVTAEMIIAGDEGKQILVGSVARQALPAGVPIARSAVVQPGERGFLAAVLPRGKRAISIPIGEVAGVSGLLMPGDRVDIILTYSVAGATIDADRDVRASETVLSNLRILALDQRLQEATPADASGADARPIARTATLEVEPAQAEMLTLATRLGELSLVLNSVADGGENAPEAVVADLGAIAAAVAGGEGAAPLRRTLTLDSEVTSLLRREPQADAEAAPSGTTASPLPRRITEVQIVRGIESRAQQFGGDGAAAANPAAIASGIASSVGALADASAPPN